MASNEPSKTKTAFKRFDAYANVAVGVILPIWAWSKRPMEMRDAAEAAGLAMQGGWVLKPLFFYGALVVSVFALIYGIRKLTSSSIGLRAG